MSTPEIIRSILDFVALGLFFFGAGKYVGSVNAAVETIKEAKEELDAIPGIKQAQEYFDERLRRLERHDSERVRSQVDKEERNS